MRASPIRPTCINPEVGEIAAQALGRVPSTTIQAHLAACTACQLERLAFESLDDHAVEPSPALRAWVRSAHARL